MTHVSLSNLETSFIVMAYIMYTMLQLGFFFTMVLGDLAGQEGLNSTAVHCLILQHDLVLSILLKV